MKTKRLKDKVWLDCIIKIERLVEQYQTGCLTENKTVGFLVEIKQGRGRTMFRQNSPRATWKEIKYSVGLHK